MADSDLLAGERDAARAGLVTADAEHEVDLGVGLELGPLELELLDEVALVAIVHVHRGRVDELARVAVHLEEVDAELPVAERAGELDDEARDPAPLLHGNVGHFLEHVPVILPTESDEAVLAREGARDTALHDVDLRPVRALSLGGGRSEGRTEGKRGDEDGRGRHADGAGRSKHARHDNRDSGDRGMAENLETPPGACTSVPVRTEVALAMVAQKLEGWSKGLVAKAERLAKRTARRTSTAHLLLELYREGREVHHLLHAEGIGEAKLMEAIRMADDESEGSLARALDHGAKLASLQGAPMQEAHLFLAITRDPRSAAHQTLLALHLTPAVLQRKLVGAAVEPPVAAPKPAAKWPSTPKLPPDIPGRAVAKRVIPPVRRRSVAAPQPAEVPDAPARVVEPAVEIAPAPSRTAPPLVSLDPEAFPVLSRLGRNLTDEARRGKIDPVIGRDAEIERVLDVLARRRSNNPILVGPPGVGKTAIVEGLARALVAPGSPLRDRLLIEVSAGALVAGTGVRGALSKKIAALVEEVEKLEGKVVLFIDEIHAVIGTGEGPDDLAHELKAALSRGRLPCVGATTEAEYRRYFERDAALARRFTRIDVGEPTPEDAVRILEGIRARYEEHHGLPITEDALEAAVELSVRFLPERHLPDKAVSMLDLAGARARRRREPVVDRATVAAVIAEQAAVPVERLLLRDGERLLVLEQEIAARVVGHEENVRRIADVLRKGAAGFYGQRPLGTFLFLGSTGVGKTEMAKAISDVFFGGGPMTRIDMSEYSEPHSVARLLGAPPGYVGHEEGGQLTEAVRGRPYQLVLLDEIEKAHPEVLLALLPLLDEGRITDGRGRTVDFKNTILVLTSNLGAQAEDATPRPRIGFGAMASSGHADAPSRAIEAARRALPPELWNRIDEPLHFGRLSRAEVAEIARRMLSRVATTLERERRVRLVVEESAIETLIALGGFDASLGARPMRRTIGRFVESPLATAILRGELAPGSLVRLTGDHASIHIVRDEAEAAE